MYPYKSGLIIGGILLLCITACATVSSRDAQSMARVFNKPYDAVWAAVEDLISNDLACIPKKINKKKGLIETEWVHRFDTEGTVRWQITAAVKQKKNGTWVMIQKRTQTRDVVSRKMSRYRKEQNEPTNNAGWTNTPVDRTSVENYYGLITDKLSKK